MSTETDTQLANVTHQQIVSTDPVTGQLVIHPDVKKRILAALGIVDDGRAIAPQVKAKLKKDGYTPAEIRAEYPKLSQTYIGPWIAAIREQVVAANWTPEMRIGKVGAKSHTIDDITFRYVRPPALKVKAWTDLELSDFMRAATAQGVKLDLDQIKANLAKEGKYVDLAKKAREVEAQVQQVTAPETSEVTV